MNRMREVESVVIALQEALPPATKAIDRLRAATVAVSAADPLRADLSPGSVRGAGRSLLLAMVASLPLLGREASSRSATDPGRLRLRSDRTRRRRRRAVP